MPFSHTLGGLLCLLSYVLPSHSLMRFREQKLQEPVRVKCSSRDRQAEISTGTMACSLHVWQLWMVPPTGLPTELTPEPGCVDDPYARCHLVVVI